MSSANLKRKNLKKKQSALAKATLSKKSQEELLLEEALFGSTAAAKASQFASVPKQHHLSVDDSNTESDISVADESDVEEEDEINFVIDTAPSAISEPVSKKSTVPGGAVWHDEDDEELVVDLNGSNRLKKLKTGEMTSTFVSGTQYSALLQNRFDSKKASVWSQSNANADSDEDEDCLDAEDYLLLTEAGGLVKSTGGHRDRFLPIAPEKISMKRLVDGNISEYCAKSVSCLEFHPHNPSLLLVASEDKNLRVFDLDDKKNEKLLGVQFKDLPILNAKFIGEKGDEILVTGRKPFFYCYHMGTGQITHFQVPHHKRQHLKTLEKMCVSPNGCLVAFVGHEGSIHLLDARSKQWIWEGKMNCSARSAHFLSNECLVTSGFDAEVYHWEIVHGAHGRVSVTCRHRMQNEDGTSSLSLASYTPPSSSSSNNNSNNNTRSNAVSANSAQLPPFYCIPDVDYLCVGAMSGVASIFQRSTLHGGDFSLMKSIMNLTTKVTSVAFHPSGQLLVIASDEKKDQLKLVHLPSGSVYMNWPRLISLTKGQMAADAGRRSSPLHRVTCVQFSPDGSRLAIGNGRGRVLMYQLNHFTEYHERRYQDIQTKKRQWKELQGSANEEENDGNR